MPRKKLEIREWKPEDAPALGQVIRKIWERGQIAGIRTPREHHHATHSFLAVRPDGEPVGFAAVIQHKPAEDPHLNLGIHPDYRGGATAFEPAQAAVGKAKAAGVAEIYAQILAKKQRGLSGLLKRLGFSLVKKSGEHALYKIAHKRG